MHIAEIQHFLSGVDLCSGLGGRTSEAQRAEGRGRKAEARVGFIRRGQLAPPHQLGGLGSAVSSPSAVWGEAPATDDFGAFCTSRTRVETTMFSLKTNNLETYLLSLAGYGTYVYVLTSHSLIC